MRRSILQNLRSVLEVYPSFYEKHFKHDATFLKEDLLSIPIRWEGSYLHFELKKVGCSSSIRGRRHQKWLPLFDKNSLPPFHKEEHSEQEFVNEVSLPPPQSQLEKADQGGTWSEVSSSLSKSPTLDEREDIQKVSSSSKTRSLEKGKTSTKVSSSFSNYEQLLKGKT